MHRRDAGVEAHLLGGLDLSCAVPWRLHSAMNSASAGFFAAAAAASGWSGAIAMKLAPNSVSGRVVKTSSSLSPFGVVAGSSAKRTSSPSERPIQFPCIDAHLLGPAVEPVERVEQLLARMR